MVKPLNIYSSLLIDSLLFILIMTGFIYNALSFKQSKELYVLGSSVSPIAFMSQFKTAGSDKRVFLEKVNSNYDIYVCYELPQVRGSVEEEYKGPLKFNYSEIVEGKLEYSIVNITQGQESISHQLINTGECILCNGTLQVISDVFIIAERNNLPVPVDYTVDLEIRYFKSSFNSLLYSSLILFSIMFTTMRFYSKIAFLENSLFEQETVKQRNYFDNYETEYMFGNNLEIGSGELRFEI